MSDSGYQPMSEDHPKPIHDVDATQFWAVLIGINAYRDSPLCGCMSDIEKMKKFLTRDLGVLEGRIQCLLSPVPYPDLLDTSKGLEQDLTSATRENIITTLLSLSTHPHIEHDDNIIIYFSGHGSSYNLSDFDKSDDISAEGFIEALCPADHTDGSDSSIQCASRVPIDLLNSICHAPSLLASSIQNMFEAAHTRLGKLPKYHSVYEGDWKPDMTSHVVLAACTDTQYAKEAKEGDKCWNGVFTQALIDALKSDDLKEELIGQADANSRREYAQ
ncbi:peptidase C14, caspase domain-containing protein [Armillaria luteobubalina]|uniref:Peptidase C14, caspase domain-containing protein n=1 Tax=Armillaria luteobubalina TaxID=153913 RepID=A0AA39TI10_9AGAR|nr:peptidase C14, caspase domain-containing protein [Armillaria luteobubalina]